MNAFINAKTAIKQLQFGPSKCYFLNVGKDIEKHKNMELYVDGWKMNEVQQIETGLFETEELFDGEQEISEKQSERYLGQIISSDGSNTQNIKERTCRGTGLGKKIIEMVGNFPGGKYQFEIIVMMRNAFIISSILSGS